MDFDKQYHRTILRLKWFVAICRESDVTRENETSSFKILLFDNKIPKSHFDLKNLAATDHRVSWRT